MVNNVHMFWTCTFMFWGFVGIISKVFCFNVCRSLTLLYVGYTPITRCCVSVNVVKHILRHDILYTAPKRIVRITEGETVCLFGP